MFDNLSSAIDLQNYFSELSGHPWKIVAFVVDILIVLFLCYEFVKIANRTKAWQLLKGIAILIVITFLSNVLNLKILNFILSSFISYGVIAIIIIFQPELRRALETLGSNGLSKAFGVDKSLRDRTKEDIYKTAIAVEEMAKSKTGALIVFETDIKLQEIIDTGIEVNSEISPQLLCNIFVPNTPLHDGAVIIRDNKISAAACILPVADDRDINKKYGTRHRAAIGVSKESDAIAVVVSEETGKISIAKDGTLIEDVSEDALKRILLKHLVNARFGEEKADRLVKFKTKMADRKAKFTQKKEARNTRYEKIKTEFEEKKK